jgi:quercetin dioxygenase-like cupin family protein
VEATMSATMHATSAVVREPGSSRATWAMGSLFEHLVESAETDGAFAMAVVTQPPGIATPLHRHTREAEMFYVLEGTLTYRAGEETFELSQGSSIFLPRGVPHAFRIRGKAPARLLALTIPGGLMGLYDEVGLPAAAHRLPGLDGHPMDVEIPHWNRVAPGYGLEVLGPPIPE